MKQNLLDNLFGTLVFLIFVPVVIFAGSVVFVIFVNVADFVEVAFGKIVPLAESYFDFIKSLRIFDR